MTTDQGVALLEDRIRDATRAAAAEITPDSMGPLRLSAAGPGRRRGRRRPGTEPGGSVRAGRRPGEAWLQRLVPLAAAATVLGVLGGLVTLAAHPPGTAAAGALPHRAPQPRQPAPPPAAHAAAGPRKTAPLGRLEHVRKAGTDQHGGQSASARKLAEMAAPATALAAIPAYYMALTRTADTDADGAAVYSSRTGARLTVIAPPAAFRSFVQVSAAADDRTFALAAQYQPAGTSALNTAIQAALAPVTSRQWRAVRHGTGPGPTSPGPAGGELRPVLAQTATGRAWEADVTARVVFFIARFDPSRNTIALSQIPGLSVPAGGWLDGIALSPDGQQLAVASQPGGGGVRDAGEIQVASVATGQGRTWRGHSGAVLGSVYPRTLSWTADSRTLAFNWDAFGPAASQPATAAAAGLRLLSIGAPAGDLVSRSRLALHWNTSNGTAAGGTVTGAAQITPDGRAVLAGLDLQTAAQPLTASPDGFAGYAAYSSVTGALRYVLDLPRVSGDPSQAEVLWSSLSGSTLIVEYPSRRGKIAVLRDGVLSPLPQPAGAQFPMAAW